MAWNYARAQDRVIALLSETNNIVVQGLKTRRQLLSEGGTAQFSASDALFNIRRNQAVLVDGVHVYARLCNYDQFRLQDDEETEDSHKRGLATLHLLYSSMDRLVQGFGAKRVDFHGARLHCVVVEPEDNEGERVLRAIALAEQLQMLVIQAAREFGRLDLTPELAVGIDSGVCVAINSGSGHEEEPLFLGSAANYAAKLADSDTPGIYLASRVRSKLGLAPLLGGLKEERRYSIQGQLPNLRANAVNQGFDLPDGFADAPGRISQLLTEWAQDIRAANSNLLTPSAFAFHAHTPPLQTIDYGALSPASSVRMPMVSIFADLDGYTDYIDRAVGAGNVQEAVRALHVIRGEFHQVLKSDFQGRKVRYIGDCIHGVLAFGTANTVDEATSVAEAVKCAVGMSESLDIIRGQLPSLANVGLATGVELGATPISRIGIRGDKSVRVASSTATIRSQRLQEDIVGVGVAIGPDAFAQLPYRAQAYFTGGQRQNSDYGDVSFLFRAAAPAIAAAAVSADEFRPHEEFRPHCSSCTSPYT